MKRPLRVLSSAAVRDAVQTTKRRRTSTDEAADDPELRKYWAQRYSLFTLFDRGIKIDREGWWSATPEAIAAHTAERCRCDLIVDAFTGVGGNAIQFAHTCQRVIAIDNSPERLACAAHNAEVYGVRDRIEFVLADFVEWVKAYARSVAQEQAPAIDVVFLSPPWGGVGYMADGDYRLSELKPLPGSELTSLARQLSDDIALYLPRNVDLGDVAQLRAAGQTVELEEEYVDGRFKTVTVFFGALAQPVLNS